MWDSKISRESCIILKYSRSWNSNSNLAFWAFFSKKISFSTKFLFILVRSWNFVNMENLFDWNRNKRMKDHLNGNSYNIWFWKCLAIHFFIEKGDQKKDHEICCSFKKKISLRFLQCSLVVCKLENLKIYSIWKNQMVQWWFY